MCALICFERKIFQYLQQVGQRRLRRIPDDIEIDVEVTMGDSVTHSAHALPRYVWMLFCEGCVPVQDLARSLTDYDEAHDDGLLRAIVRDELVLA